MGDDVNVEICPICLAAEGKKEPCIACERGSHLSDEEYHGHIITSFLVVHKWLGNVCIVTDLVNHNEITHCNVNALSILMKEPANVLLYMRNI